MTDDRFLNQCVAKITSDVPFFGTVIAVHQDKTDKQRKVHEVCFDNIKETEEVYTSMIRDWPANYNNPDISQHDKCNLWRVGDEKQPVQSPKEKHGGD